VGYFISHAEKQICLHSECLLLLSVINKIETKSDVWLTVHRNSVWIRKTN